MPTIDLYVLLVDPPDRVAYSELHHAAIALSRVLVADDRIGQDIGRIAWINGHESDDGQLSFSVAASNDSTFRKKKT